MLQILDHDNLEAYHMNEGHAALSTLELMDRYQQDLEKVKEICVFTTHTPVPADYRSCMRERHIRQTSRERR